MTRMPAEQSAGVVSTWNPPLRSVVDPQNQIEGQQKMQTEATAATALQLQAENDALRQHVAFLEAQLRLKSPSGANLDRPPMMPAAPYSWEIDRPHQNCSTSP